MILKLSISWFHQGLHPRHAEMRDPLYDLTAKSILSATRTLNLLMKKPPHPECRRWQRNPSDVLIGWVSPAGHPAPARSVPPNLIVGSHGLYSSGDSPKQSNWPVAAAKWAWPIFDLIIGAAAAAKVVSKRLPPWQGAATIWSMRWPFCGKNSTWGQNWGFSAAVSAGRPVLRPPAS